jgi:hypothetical protein
METLKIGTRKCHDCGTIKKPHRLQDTTLKLQSSAEPNSNFQNIDRICVRQGISAMDVAFQH